jgi:SAM-dependent methyltransferase
MSELERWEQRFSAQHYVFGTEPNSFLKSKAHLLKPGQKAFTLADGEGRNGVWLAEQGLEVHSVDISPKGIAKAHALAAERGVKLHTEQADLATWVWPTNAYDVIVGIFFQIWFPPERARIFAGIKQALRPGGVLLMQNYRTDQLKYRKPLYARAARGVVRRFLFARHQGARQHDQRRHRPRRHVRADRPRRAEMTAT